MVDYDVLSSLIFPANIELKMNKTRSLKSVLEPFSSAGNMGLLKRAGFKDIVTIQKSICFEGWLAIK